MLDTGTLEYISPVKWYYALFNIDWIISDIRINLYTVVLGVDSWVSTIISIIL